MVDVLRVAVQATDVEALIQVGDDAVHLVCGVFVVVRGRL
jgi:hypothetical protein